MSSVAPSTSVVLGPLYPGTGTYRQICTCILRVKVAALHGVERPSPIYAGRGSLGRGLEMQHHLALHVRTNSHSADR